MSHFGDVLPSQYPGLVLKKETKHNKSKQHMNKIIYANTQKNEPK